MEVIECHSTTDNVDAFVGLLEIPVISVYHVQHEVFVGFVSLDKPLRIFEKIRHCQAPF